MKIKTLLFLLLTSCFLSAQDYILSDALTDIEGCGGFIIDSGGNGGGYGPNENFTVTICPDTTVGTHVQLIFSGWQIMAGDVICFFDGTDISAPFLGCTTDFEDGAAFVIQATAPNTDGCLTMAFNSDAAGEGAGWSAAINCVPACQTIIAVLENTDPLVVPSDTGWIDICPGERVFFEAHGEYPQDGAVYSHSNFTSDFTWDFGDGGTSFGLNVFHVFEEPGGYIVQVNIRDQLGCRNTNFISQRIRVAPKPNFDVGDFPDQICMNDTIGLNAAIGVMGSNSTVQVIPVESSFQSTSIRSDSLPLPDGNGLSYETSISFFDFSPGQILTDINDLLGIRLTIEHSYMRDIEISLTCPNGQSAVLHDHAGQVGGEVFLGVPFQNDEGLPTPIPGGGFEYGWQTNPDFNATWIEYANTNNPNTLPPGTYESFEPLQNFLGCPLNGEWAITVTDLWPIDNGYIFNWSIGFAEDLYPDLETFTPMLANWYWNDHPSIFYNEMDSITGSPNSAGQVGYTFTVEDEFGCDWDTSISVQVLPFAHPDCYSCVDLLDSLPDASICEDEVFEIDATSPYQDTTIIFESFENYPIGNGNHPPGFPYISTIDVNSVNPTIIVDPLVDIISICLDMETDFNSDLVFLLQSPNGQMLELSTNNGGGQDNYTQTCFTPTATVPISAGTSPFTGDFQPEGDWNILTGEPTNGAWRLWVSDAFGPTSFGTLNWWTITFRATENIVYEWSPATGLTCTDCPVPTADPGMTQQYDLLVSNDFGCEEQEGFTLNVLSIFDAPNVTCQELPGGQMELTWNEANASVEYEININSMGWEMPNNGNLSHLANGLIMGDVVNVEVQAITGGATCVVDIGTASCTYTLCPILTNITGQPPFFNNCFGICDGVVELDIAVGMAPYSFDVTNTTMGNNFTQNSNVLVGLCPGIYEVQVTDDIGCNEIISFEIENREELLVTAAELQAVSCFGGNDGTATATAEGGAPPYIFTWNDPAMSVGEQVGNLPIGAITVTAMDANGCATQADATVTEPAEVTLVFSAEEVSCFGGNDGSATVMPSGGTPPYNYFWDSGNTPTQPTTILAPVGTHTVVVTDDNGCQATGSVDVTEPSDPLQITANQTFTSCFGENANEASASAMGGSGTYDFIWKPSNQSGAQAVGLPSGNVEVVVTDGNGCMDSLTLLMVEYDVIEFDLQGISSPCFDGMDGQAAVTSVLGGTGMGYSYDWSNGETASTITDLQGDQTYTVTVYDSQGCSSEKATILTNPPGMQLTSEIADALCTNSASGSICITNVLNGNGNLSYQWDAAAMNQTTACANSLLAGNYTVVITDASGCSITEIFSVNEDSPLLLSAVVQDNPCYGYEEGGIEITVSGGTPAFSFLWSNGETKDQLADLPAGIYDLTVTDANGCTAVENLTVGQPEEVALTADIKDVSCFEYSDGVIAVNVLGGTLPYAYSLDDQPFTASPNFLALTAGDYEVAVKDANGCIYSLPATLTEPPLMTASILANGNDEDEFLIGFGESIYFDTEIENGIGNFQYEWTAAWCGTMTCLTDSTDCTELMLCSNPSATPTSSNDYFVTITDENGCMAEDHIQVHVLKDNPVDVPTGFTPNDDNLNDLLLVHGKSGTTITSFQVFDRWGELLFEDGGFEINDMASGWDGTFKGDDMPSGVYVWYLVVRYADGEDGELKGEVTLLR